MICERASRSAGWFPSSPIFNLHLSCSRSARQPLPLSPAPSTATPLPPFTSTFAQVAESTGLSSRLCPPQISPLFSKIKMKSTIALSLLATALSVGTASASADSHRVLERRAAGHALPAKRFVKRTVRHGARECDLVHLPRDSIARERVPKLTLVPLLLLRCIAIQQAPRFLLLVRN